MTTDDTNQDSANTGLSEEEQALLEEMKTALALQASLPESERAKIVNQDKFAFPIGLDEHGQPLTGEAAKQIYADLASDVAAASGEAGEGTQAGEGEEAEEADKADDSASN